MSAIIALMKAAKTTGIFLLVVGLVAAAGLAQRRGGPPRRVSNPQNFELAGGSRVEFRSFHAPSLGKATEYSIYLPPAYDREDTAKFPVIYFLHGMFNDHTSWTVERYGNFPARIESLLLDELAPPFVMVHPDGNNSLYTDLRDGSLKYEQYIYQDLIQEIEGNYRVKTGPSERALGGISLGGYGALKIAMKYPQLYASVAVGSPIILVGEDPSSLINPSHRRASFFSRLFTPVFGSPVDRDHWSKNSVEMLALHGDLKSLNIYFAYGTADRYNEAFPLEKGVRTLDHILTDRRVSHQFQIYEGEPHGWALVGNHLQEMVSFLTQSF